VIDDRRNLFNNSSLHRVSIRQRHRTACPHEAVLSTVDRIISKTMPQIAATIEKSHPSTVQSHPTMAIDRLDPASNTHLHGEIPIAPNIA